MADLGEFWRVVAMGQGRRANFSVGSQNRELMRSTLHRERKGFYSSDEPPGQAGTTDAPPFEILASCSIIAAVNSAEKFTQALDSPDSCDLSPDGNAVGFAGHACACQRPG
jgi:hypothetical protein